MNDQTQATIQLHLQQILEGWLTSERTSGGWYEGAAGQYRLIAVKAAIQSQG